MKPNEMKVRQGGLMRCCLASLDDYLNGLTEIPPVGTTVDCKYEADKDNKNMILASDGIWEWNKEEQAKRRDK